MRWFVFLVFLALVSGCLGKGGEKFEYERVYVKYAVSGGLVPPDKYSTEYVLDGTNVSYGTRYPNGSYSYYKGGMVEVKDSKGLGEYITGAGFYGMPDKYVAAAKVSTEGRPNARLSVSIDGKNKTIAFEPYLEDYTPGSVQKVIFELRSMTRGLQP